MEIRFYNTLAHQTQPFSPIDPPHVYMYNCGPTVYDYAHIGNFRAFIFADLLRRFLELIGYQVHQVMNITDVGHMTDDQLADGAGEDKMQLAARRLKEAKKQGSLPSGAADNPDDPYQVAQYYLSAFLEDARQLGLKIADEYAPNPALTKMPRATDHVPQMILLIQKLIAAGHAYVGSDSAVYYDVQTFPNYGKLSGNSLDKLKGGAGGRVQDHHQTAKRNPADFLLWKPDPNHIMKWDSPWGLGYPGWHIECSAMAMHVLGRQTIDIHTGGEDNIFPHHECEIAQSCGATGNPFFARFWMHTRHLLVDGQKMSKSKGNFFTVRDVLQGRVTSRPVDPAVLRFELLKAHYRSNMNFSVKGLEESASAVDKLRRQAASVKTLLQHTYADPAQAIAETPPDFPAMTRFKQALADDLNISAALAEVYTWLRSENREPVQEWRLLRSLNEVIQFELHGDTYQLKTSIAVSSQTKPMMQSIVIGSIDESIVAICNQIDQARKNKDFAAADRHRKDLIAAGYDVMTTPNGTVAKKKLA